MPSLLRLSASPLAFDLQAQGWLESLDFGHMGFLEINHGKGRIFWSAEPVELAQGDQPAADVYDYVMTRIGIQASFGAPPGILIFQIPLSDSVLYVVESDTNVDSPVQFQDPVTGVHVSFNLPAGHAAMALVGKKEKAVVAKYGF